MEIDKKYSINDVATQLSLSLSTIRKYEEDYNIHIRRNELGHREYREEDIQLLQAITDMKKEGHNIHTIRRVLNKNPEALEQKEKSLEFTEIQNLNGVEFIQLMKKSLEDTITSMQDNFKAELTAAKEEIVEEVRQEFKAHSDQMKGENTKLLDYIQRERETPKGFWNKVLNRK